MFGDITVYHMGTRTWAPLGRKRVCHSSASSVRQVAALGGPAGDSLGGSALGHSVQACCSLWAASVSKRLRKRVCWAVRGGHPAPRTLGRRPDHCPVIAE